MACAPSEDSDQTEHPQILIIVFAVRMKKGSLREHAYSNILIIILQPKKENFQIRNSDIFHISAQNINCGYSLEPPLCFKQK